MGCTISKATLPKDDDILVGGQEGKPGSEDRAALRGGEEESRAATAREDGQPSSTEPRKREKKKSESEDVVAELLKRANAGGVEERLAAARAAAPDVEADDDSDGETDQRRFMDLLGGGPPSGGAKAVTARASSTKGTVRFREDLNLAAGAPGHPAESRRVPSSPTGDADSDPRSESDGEEDRRAFLELLGGARPPSRDAKVGALRAVPVKAPGLSKEAPSQSRAPRPAGHSVAAMRAAARAGVPLPSVEDEEEYDLLDAYADDLLGIPESQRPSSFKRPTINETEAVLRSSGADTVLRERMRGEVLEPLPQRGGWQRPESEAPTSGRPSLLPPAGPKAIPRSSDEFLSGVIHGWAGIDAGDAANDTASVPPATPGPDGGQARPLEAPPGGGAGAASEAKATPVPSEPTRAAPPEPVAPASVALRFLGAGGPAPKRKATARSGK